MSGEDSYKTTKWTTLGKEKVAYPNRIKMSDMSEQHLLNAYRTTKRNYEKLQTEGRRRGINLDVMILPKKERDAFLEQNKREHQKIEQMFFRWEKKNV